PPGSTPFPYTTLFRSRCAVTSCLRPLQHASDVLVDRVRRDKKKLGRETALLGPFGLFDRRGRSKCCLDSERLLTRDVLEDESFRSEEHTSELQSRFDL